MKFLLDFVSCCGRQVTLSEDSRRREAEVAIVGEERSSEAEARRHRRRKRVRMGHQAAGAVTQWKPSLCAISEDKIVMEEGEKSLLEMKAEGVAKWKSGGASQSKVHVRSYYRDDYGRNSVQTIIPAFSPVPFMF
ncbi:hypothetical protein SLA2020_120690 [Shorea laevis]